MTDGTKRLSDGSIVITRTGATESEALAEARAEARTIFGTGVQLHEQVTGKITSGQLPDHALITTVSVKFQPVVRR